MKQILVNKRNNKFWSVEDFGTHRMVTWGYLWYAWGKGEKPIGQTKQLRSADELVRDKLKNGIYVKITP